jgi:hypothetical protein
MLQPLIGHFEKRHPYLRIAIHALKKHHSVIWCEEECVSIQGEELYRPWDLDAETSWYSSYTTSPSSSSTWLPHCLNSIPRLERKCARKPMGVRDRIHCSTMQGCCLFILTARITIIWRWSDRLLLLLLMMMMVLFPRPHRTHQQNFPALQFGLPSLRVFTTKPSSTTIIQT